MKTLSSLFLLTFFVSLLYAQEITQWRGLNRTGYFPSENLLSVWPIEGPELILHLDSLGESYSSVVMKNEILFTTGIIDTAEILTAISLDGKILWNTTYGKAWTKSYKNARCTPTIDGSFAYMISGSGDLASVNIKTGNLEWSINGYEKFEGIYGDWGIGESPLIVDNKFIYTPGGEKTTVVALDKTNGETLWMSESIGDESSYCSPIVIERGGQKLIITVTNNHVICLNANNGEFLWKYKYIDIEKPFMGGDINPVTPLVVGNEIFVTSGYNHVGIMLKMADDLKSVQLKWISEDLDVHHGGVVTVDGYIYGANYTSIRGGNWVCIKWETGQLMYEQDWNTKGQIIASDGFLICYDERIGDVALVKITPDEFKITSSFQITKGKGPHWSHPTIYDDKLFLRHGKDLMGYKIGE